jgi:hypothetical protein
MSPSLDKQLCEKYPKIFKNRSASMQESCMHWGICVGDGWYNIIDMLCMAMSHSYSTGITIDKEDADKFGIPRPDDEGPDRYYLTVESPQVIADQVKEKFGTLRFYYHLEFDKKVIDINKTGKYLDLQKIINEYHHFFDGMVHMAETMSAHTCEDTGREGEMHASDGTLRGWRRVLNREYAKANEFYVSKNYVPVKDLPNDDEL